MGQTFSRQAGGGAEGVVDEPAANEVNVAAAEDLLLLAQAPVVNPLPGLAPAADPSDPSSPASTSSSDSKRSKRKRHLTSTEEEEEDIDLVLNTPTRKKLKTTSRYIYETLFLGSQQWDVVVEAMGKEWKLHKHYLLQSAYFSSMFSGSWEESGQSRVRIMIADPNVTTEALNVAFGSLYEDEINVEPGKVIPILAAATLLQLDGLIRQCSNIMTETINFKTAVTFHEAAGMYGITDIEKKCLHWLQVNMLCHLPEHPDSLRDVPIPLMCDVIDSSDLFVMQTEFSVYVLLRLWLFLIKHPHWNGNATDAVVASHRFFLKRAKENPNTSYLETSEGQPYVEVFKKLRFNHLVNHHMDMETQVIDRIIPESWMWRVYRNQWQTLLKIDQGMDKGPQEIDGIDFDKNCLRCGRTLTTGGQQHMWRWTGFNMGLDLIVTFDNFTLTLKRNHSSTSTNEHEAMLSMQKKRKLYYKVNVAALNDQKQTTYMARTGLHSASLNKNGHHMLLKLDKEKATFPLLLSFNFLVTTPTAATSDGGEEVPIEEVQAQAAEPVGDANVVAPAAAAGGAD